MPLYMTIHTLPPGGVTAQRIEEIAREGQQDPHVRGYRSFHSPAEGRLVWLLEAPNREAVAAWCRRVGLPLDALTGLEMEGHRGVLRPAHTTLPNQVRGMVARVRTDVALALVTVNTPRGGHIEALVSAERWGAMAASVGDTVTALFKAMNVSLARATPEEPFVQLSFPNQIKGTVTRIIEGPTLVIVHVDTPVGEIVSAIIPSAAERIGLKIGDEVTALFKALDVSLAKEP